MMARNNLLVAVLACLGLGAAVLPIESVEAQSRAKAYEDDEIPTEVEDGRALLWFRLAKHSDHRWGMDVDIGLGVLIGNVRSSRTKERIPLDKPLWPAVQIAAWDPDANEFLGEGESPRRLRRSQTRSFYIPRKDFFFEDENYRHYLVAVSTGNYVLGGTPNTCFCWGTKWFEVSAGQVINMGIYYVATENGLSYWPELAAFDSADDLAEQNMVADTMRLTPPSSDDTVPSALSNFELTSVEYQDAAYFPNRFGRLVNMMIPDDWEPGQALTLPPSDVDAEPDESL